MRLPCEQLAAALKRGLAPVYFLTGDEPLQLGEAADAVRQAAREAGYVSREVFHADGTFNWNVLQQEADSLSLFSDRKVLDLRLPSGKPGTEGAKALMEYAKSPPADTIFLIIAGKLAQGAAKGRWVQALDRAGVVVQVRPLEGPALLKWLERRMDSRGLSCDREALQLLASRIEGNLLAAAQEIDKLFVLKGAGHVDADTILDVVVNSSRYDVFNLMDSILQGKARRSARILAGLHAEDMAPAVVLWALARELRLLIQIAWDRNKGLPLETAFRNHHVWDKRKPLLSRALDRFSLAQLLHLLRDCASVDRVIKGMEKGDPWESLFVVSMDFAGAKI